MLFHTRSSLLSATALLVLLNLEANWKISFCSSDKLTSSWGFRQTQILFGRWVLQGGLSHSNKSPPSFHQLWIKDHQILIKMKLLLSVSLWQPLDGAMNSEVRTIQELFLICAFNWSKIFSWCKSVGMSSKGKIILFYFFFKSQTFTPAIICFNSQNSSK